jgi:Ca-activated chloride channel homolog
MDFLGIYWAGIDKLIYAPFVLLIIFFIIKNYVRIKRSSDYLSHPKTRKQVYKHFSIGRQLLKTILLISGVVLIFLAFLQPQWGKKDQKIIQEGRDLLILFDISRSMLAEDFKPNRLEFAKLKIRDLLSRLNFDRVGLVVYSGAAFLQCPLTRDYSALQLFLDTVDVETISSGTTAIDKALTKAVDIFKQSTERKNKLVLLITDGEDFSMNLESVREQAKEQNITLFALGTATIEGAPIPKFDVSGNQIGHEKEGKTIVLSKLNEPLLKNMCEKLKGIYLRAGYDDSDIDQIVGHIKSFEKERFSDREISLYEEQYSWFLGAAWILMLLEWIL